MGGNTEYYLIKHFILIILSFIAMWFSHRIDYKYYSKIALIGLYASIPLLIITYKFGMNINEASRWINIPILIRHFNPPDLAKLSLIIYLSSFLAKTKQIRKCKNSYFTFFMDWINLFIHCTD